MNSLINKLTKKSLTALLRSFKRKPLDFSENKDTHETALRNIVLAKRVLYLMAQSKIFRGKDVRRKNIC